MHLLSTELPDGLRLSLSDRQAILKHQLSDKQYRDKVLSGIRGHVRPTQTANIAAAPAASSARPILIGAGLIAIAVIAGSVLLYMKPGEEDSASSAPIIVKEQTVPSSPTAQPAVAQMPSIAVLPFVDMSQSKDQEYFSDGIAEEILNGLTKNPGLKVIARSSAFSFKGRNVDVREIGETLGVGHVLEGSVRTSGNRIRVSAQLINTVDGSQVWSDRYESELTDIFKMQDDISRAILTALNVHLLPRAEGVAVASKANINAYNALLKGRYYFNQDVQFQYSAENLDKSAAFFEEAIAIDPEYADAHGWLARIHNLYVWTQFDSVANRLPLVEANVEKALALDPNQVEALATRATNRFFVYREYQGAIDDLTALAKRYPSNTALLSLYKQPLRAIGRYDLSLAIGERMVLLDPLEPFALTQRSVDEWLLGRYDGAIEWLLKAEELGVDRSLIVFWNAHHLGDRGLVNDRLARLESLYGKASQAFVLSTAFLHGQQGNFAAAREIQNPLRESGGYQSYWLKINMALREGEIERAHDLYRLGLDANEYIVLLAIKGAPWARRSWPAFFASPRFEALLRDNGLDDESVAKLTIPDLPF